MFPYFCFVIPEANTQIRKKHFLHFYFMHMIDTSVKKVEYVPICVLILQPLRNEEKL